MDKTKAAGEFSELLQELKTLTAQLGELSSDRDEHAMVIETLRGVDAGRKCFRLIRGVLVERTVGEVLPMMEATFTNIREVHDEIAQRYAQKDRRAMELQTKYRFVQ